MSYQANLEDPKIEKHTLVVLKPRMRLTGWELFYNGGMPLETWRVRAPHYVTRVWNTYAEDDGLLGSLSLALVKLNNNSFWYDHATGWLYFTGIPGGTNEANPDDNDYPGLTVELELHVSDQAFQGPRDPKDPTSTVVNWVPALSESPFAQTGDRTTLYGFLPINESGIALKNHDGWLSPIIYDSSWNYCALRAFTLANPDLNDGIIFDEIRQIFSGYTKGIQVTDFSVQIECADLLYFFSRSPTLRTFAELVGVAPYNVEPEAIKTGAPWKIRQIFGLVQNVRPVNVDYNAAFSTTNNRIWITNQRYYKRDGTPAAEGTIVQTLNSAGANSATRTYLLTTPKVMEGEAVVVKRGGTDYGTVVTAVNRTLNYIDHQAIGGGAAIVGDTLTRPFISRVRIVNENNVTTQLAFGIDWNLLVDDTNNIRGFRLTNNFEASYGITMDPSKVKLFADCYGTSSLDQYGDASDVGPSSVYGGVKNTAVQLIYRLLLDSGFSQADIADSMFQDLAATSFTVGFSLPATRDELTIPKYSDLINEILKSNLYRLSISDIDDELLLGLTELKPYAGNPDFSADELNHRGLQFQQAYDQVYSSIVIGCAKVEEVTPEDADVGRGQSVYTQAVSQVARDLHFISAEMKQDTLLTTLEEAFTLATRLAFALGDRRGYWGTSLEISYLNRVNLGATYRLTRQQMPGFAYADGVENSMTLVVAEVNKNSNGVNIVLEDQKGVQDNAADW